MSDGRTIAANAALMTAARVGGMALSLLTFGYLTRTLGPDGYGVLAWGLAVLGYFSAFVELGLGTLYVREVARAPERVRELAGWLVSLRSVLIGVALLAFAAMVASLDRDAGEKAALAVIGLSLVGLGASLDWAYHGTQRMGRLAVKNVFIAVVTLGVALAFVRGPADLVWAAAATTGGIVAGSLVMAVVFTREYGWIRPRVELGAWRTLLRSSVPIGFSLFLMQVYATIDQVMLGAFRSDAEIGWYASAYRVVTAAFVVDQILQQVFLPALAESPPSEPEGFARARDYVGAMALLGVPLAAGVAVYAAPVLTAFAGAAYAPGGPALQVLLAFAAVVYVSKAWGDSLVAWGHERLFLRAVAGAAAVNVIANVLLIPTYGLDGAAWATLLAGIVAAIGMGLPYRRLVGTLHSASIARVVAATAVGVLAPALGVRALGGAVWVAVGLTLPLYAAAAYALGAFPEPVLNAIRARIKPASSQP